MQVKERSSDHRDHQREDYIIVRPTRRRRLKADRVQLGSCRRAAGGGFSTVKFSSGSPHFSSFPPPSPTIIRDGEDGAEVKQEVGDCKGPGERQGCER